MVFGLPGIIFGMSCRVDYGDWARGYGPWVVRVAKMSTGVISSASLFLFYREVATDEFQGKFRLRCNY